MPHRLLYRALIVGAVFAAGCTQHSPTGPSPVALANEPIATSSQSSEVAAAQRPLVIDWQCFAQNIGCAFLPAPAMVFAEVAPGSPINLAFQVTGSTVTLTWTASAGGPAVSYLIEAGTGPGLSNIVGFNTGNAATSFTVTAVPAGAYFVRVRARNADGTSGPSNEVVITVGCTSAASPAGLTASVSGSIVTLSWTGVADAITYIVEGGPTPGVTDFAFETGSVATTFSGSAPAGTHYLRVRVRTACGTSGASNEVTVTISAGPSPPPSPGHLSGLWSGTATIFERGSAPEVESLEMDIMHIGTRLSGQVRVVGEGPMATFEATQSSSSDPSLYDVAFGVGRPDPGCPVTMNGWLRVLSATSIQGAITTGDAPACQLESVTFAINKVR